MTKILLLQHFWFIFWGTLFLPGSFLLLSIKKICKIQDGLWVLNRIWSTVQRKHLVHVKDAPYICILPPISLKIVHVVYFLAHVQEGGSICESLACLLKSHFGIKK